MRYAALFVMFAFVQGCASTFSGTYENVIIVSKPQGQQIEIDGTVYSTPAGVFLARWHDHTVKFPNGATLVITSIPFGNPTVLLNLVWLLAGVVPAVVGFIIDFWTGAAGDLEPDYLEYSDGLIIDRETGLAIGGWKSGPPPPEGGK